LRIDQRRSNGLRLLMSRFSEPHKARRAVTLEHNDSEMVSMAFEILTVRRAERFILQSATGASATTRAALSSGWRSLSAAAW
jgi:hypothetical protein